jgi:hypothetical protein
MRIDLDWEQREILTELANDALSGIAHGDLHYDDNDDMVAQLNDIIITLNPRSWLVIWASRVEGDVWYECEVMDDDLFRRMFIQHNEMPPPAAPAS